MTFRHWIMGFWLLVGPQFAWADDIQAWKSRLTFHASFDQSADADVAAGDRRIFTASNLSREHVQPGLHTPAVSRDAQGRWGHCLLFTDTAEPVVFYTGQGNIPYDRKPFGMTVSFWLRLSPDEDLKPGYVDPLQITDKQWNDAALFVDFTKDERPRHFRLGVFSNLAFWNPQNTAWEQIAPADRPMVTVTAPPFRRDQWTHVAITLDGINATDQAAAAKLYLNGEPQGTLTRPQQFEWDPQRVAMMLGIQYIGGLDDLAVFRGAMTAAEIQLLRDLPTGVAGLR
jgi:hypothetical protein